MHSSITAQQRKDKALLGKNKIKSFSKILNFIQCSNAQYFLANRISFVLGLCGPSIMLDTACSGSGYALNCALRSIMTGECDAALVAGSNLILSQVLTTEHGR
jgi:acyl transferase domain-containing protein